MGLNSAAFANENVTTTTDQTPTISTAVEKDMESKVGLDAEDLSTQFTMNTLLDSTKFIVKNVASNAKSNLNKIKDGEIENKLSSAADLLDTPVIKQIAENSAPAMVTTISSLNNIQEGIKNTGEQIKTLSDKDTKAQEKVDAAVNLVNTPLMKQIAEKV